MHEKRTHGPTWEGSAARTMAAQYWQVLCGKDNADMVAEFDNSYLGWWDSRTALAETLRLDFGWQSVDQAHLALATMEEAGELAVVTSPGGCHAFIAPGAPLPVSA